MELHSDTQRQEPVVYWVTRGPAGFVRVHTTDYLTAEIHTNFAPTSIRAWRRMGSLPISSWATYVF